MKKNFILYLSIMISMLVGSCGENATDEPKESNGPFVLTEMVVLLDGVETSTIPLASGFKVEREGELFFYEDDGDNTGEWSIDEAEENLQILYGQTEANFPIVSNANGTLTIKVAEIDLTKSGFSVLEQKVLLVVNLNELESGRGLQKKLNGASTLSLLYKLTN